MRLAVTGATGFIGGAVHRTAETLSWHVHAYGSRDWDTASSPPHDKVIVVDAPPVSERQCGADRARRPTGQPMRPATAEPLCRAIRQKAQMLSPQVPEREPRGQDTITGRPLHAVGTDRALDGMPVSGRLRKVDRTALRERLTR